MCFLRLEQNGETTFLDLQTSTAVSGTTNCPGLLHVPVAVLQQLASLVPLIANMVPSPLQAVPLPAMAEPTCGLGDLGLPHALGGHVCTEGGLAAVTPPRYNGRRLQHGWVNQKQLGLSCLLLLIARQRVYLPGAGGFLLWFSSGHIIWIPQINSCCFSEICGCCFNCLELWARHRTLVAQNQLP